MNQTDKEKMKLLSEWDAVRELVRIGLEKIGHDILLVLPAEHVARSK